MATNPDGSAPFGTLLRQLRLRAGLSQEALAERARLSIEAVSALERGARRAPQHQTLALLADALRVMPADRAQLEASATGARLAAGQSRMRRARRGVEGAPANEAEDEKSPMTAAILGSSASFFAMVAACFGSD